LRSNFLPATGKLVHLRPPTSASDVRVETGVREGDEVRDSLLLGSLLPPRFRLLLAGLFCP
jgi:hypothetical protein